MKYIFFSIVILIFLNACSEGSKSKSDPNKEEWISLFNGVDLENWDVKFTKRNLNENYKNTFVVEDGMIRVSYDNYKVFDKDFGHMYYKTPYSYYRLRFDYRYVGDQIEGGSIWNVRNSGVMLHSQSAKSNEKNQTFPFSVEFQLLGGLGNEDRTTGNVCTPGTVVMMQDTLNYDHCIKSVSKTYQGDQWVHVEAIVLGGESMIFKINDEVVLEFDLPQIEDFSKRKPNYWEKFGIENSIKYWTNREGEVLNSGYIALQAESSPVDFKNIELLDLCGCMDRNAKNYKTYYVKNIPSGCEY